MRGEGIADGEDGQSASGTPADNVSLTWPRWQQIVLSAASLLDRPFARLPVRLKNVLGLVGAVVFLAGVAVWVIGLRR